MPDALEQSPGDFQTYRNQSLHTGQNTRLNGRLLADTEATGLLNVDITTPGIRQAKLQPSYRFQNVSHVNGLTTFAPAGGDSKVFIAGSGPAYYTWDGTTLATLSGTPTFGNALAGGPVFFQQALDGTSGAYTGTGRNCIYGTDATNPIIKFDVSGGTQVTAPGILAADGVTAMSGCADISYFFDRMWYALGDNIYFSDVGCPQSITNAPLSVRRGAGNQIIRLMPYRDQYLLVFKGGKGNLGSVTVLSIGTNDPSTFSESITPLYDNLSIVAPAAITRIASNSDADILFYTLEGWRSIAFTDLDALLGVTTPLTYSIPDIIAQINAGCYQFNITNPTLYDLLHATVFNDELLLWYPAPGQSGTILATTCIGNSRLIPGNSPTQGWVQYDMMPCSYTTVIKSDHITYASGNQGPFLILGNAVTGDLQYAYTFSAPMYLQPNYTYTEIGKRIDYGLPNQDKITQFITFFLDVGHNQPFTPTLLFDDNTTQALASITDTGPTTVTRDLHFAALGGAAKSFKDVRVQIAATANFVETQMALLGYELECLLEEESMVPPSADRSALPTATAYSQAQIAHTNYSG